jgi:hypothetical protein
MTATTSNHEMLSHARRDAVVLLLAWAAQN